MIQQTQYTPTTTKYNFPQLDTALPTRFIELSLRSIKNIHEGADLYQPYETLTEESLNPTEETTPVFHGQTKLKLNTIPLKPAPLSTQQETTPIVAIDVSSIKIGETQTGILLAIRGAIVWKKQHHSYHYLRIGPFPFHITEENKAEISQLFQQYSLETSEHNHYQNASAPSLIHMQTRITTLLERWLQQSIANQSQNTLILLDGSLTAGTPDTPINVLSQLLETARNRFNTILAFTKITRLRLSGHRLTDLIQKCTPPCLLEMEGYPTALSPTIRFLGNIYVAKLSPSPTNCSFRLDIDRSLSTQQAIEATQRLIANDSVADSYPETLRLAHIYSTFTANEIIAIQRLLAQTHGIKTITRPNIRRLLFGPFGKGPEPS